MEYLLAGWQHDFPVMEQGRLVGLLTRSALLEGLAQHGKEAAVGDFMFRQFPTIDPGETADAALLRLRARDGNTILAARDGALEGLVTSDKIGEFLMVQAALARRNGEGETRSTTVELGPATSVSPGALE
jgi:predicted transcriptional regulator